VFAANNPTQMKVTMKHTPSSIQEIMHLSYHDTLGPKQIKQEENVISCKLHQHATYGLSNPDQLFSFCVFLSVSGTVYLI
jgi:hypothetical protein